MIGGGSRRAGGGGGGRGGGTSSSPLLRSTRRLPLLLSCRGQDKVAKMLTHTHKDMVLYVPYSGVTENTV